MIQYLLRAAPFALVISMALGGCATTQTERLYALNSVDVEKNIDTLAIDKAITVQVAGIPDTIDRPELIVLTGSSQLTLLENDIWAEPIKSGINRVLKKNMQAIFPASFVSNDFVSLEKNSVSVLIWIDEMSVKTDGDVRLSATWVVRGTQTKSAKTGKLSLKRNLDDRPNTQQIVLAWSEEYLELSRQIAKSIVNP